MQVLIDFLPIIVFFVTYKVAGMFAATAALIAATAIQVAVQWIRQKTVNKMLLISAGMVAVFGGITLALKDPLFIQWKVTVVYWILAVAFLCGATFLKKSLVERSVGHAIELPRTMWRQLDLIWGVAFALIGALNLFVMYNYDEGTWVNFKLFGTLGITLVIVVAQVFWIASRAPQDKSEGTEKPHG
jgi:intracellular septation protein